MSGGDGYETVDEEEDLFVDIDDIPGDQEGRIRRISMVGKRVEVVTRCFVCL